MFKNIKTPEQLQLESEKEMKLNRIQELKQLLQESDFKVLLDYDQDNTQVKADRQLWRDEIRQLGLEVSQ